MYQQREKKSISEFKPLIVKLVMTKNELIQEFVEIFNELSTDDKVYLHNAFLYESDYDGYTILNNLDGETLDDYLQGLSKAEIKRRKLNGRYNPNQVFFWVNGNGDIFSCDYEEDLPLHDAEIYAEYFIENLDAISDMDVFEEFCENVENGFEE